ncbi:hypothetical protein J5X84_34395 [Streptosporangiaceae bacterium NEAU-GS5]|nr:hypothetical protein [Streptosporangiaceae bacterium NEAU-GS5]
MGIRGVSRVVPACLALAVLAGCTATGSAKPSAAPATAASAKAALAGPAFSDPAFSTLVAELSKDVAGVWPRTAEIWPAADFSKLVLLVASSTEAAAITVNGAEPVEPAKLHQQDFDWDTGMRLARWNGRPAIFLPDTLGQAGGDLTPSQSLFKIATHEAFHAYVQKTGSRAEIWPSMLPAISGRETRDTDFPLRVAPRYFRAMAYNQLLAAYRNPDERPARLAAAAYWARRWSKEYPGEERRLLSTDILEGTAEYFCRVALARAEGESDLSVGMGPITGLRASDEEAYKLGVLAGLMADERGLDWKAAMRDKRRTPLSWALDGVEPVRQPDAPELRTAIEAKADEKNKELQPQIAGALADFLQPTLLLIKAGATDVSAFSTTGFYRARSLPYSIILGTTMKAGELTIENHTIFSGIVDGQLYYMIPFKSAGRLAGDQVSFDEKGLTGYVTVTPGPEIAGKETYVHE